MPHVICQPCIGTKNAACTDVCPAEAIHPLRSESNHSLLNQLFIDPSMCTDCGQCAGVCPVGAIYPDVDVPYEWRHFIERNAEYYGQ